MGVLELLGLFSLLTFVGSLIAVPWLIGRMQADYFLTHWHKVESRHRRHPVLTIAIWGFRNAVGLCLLLASLGPGEPGFGHGHSGRQDRLDPSLGPGGPGPSPCCRLSP